LRVPYCFAINFNWRWELPLSLGQYIHINILAAEQVPYRGEL